MNSNLHDEIIVLEERWKELSEMISLVKDKRTPSRKKPIYLKAAFLMLCSHFEGGFYGVLKGILSDINEASDYVSLPEPLVRAYVKYTLLGNQDVKGQQITKITKELLRQEVNLKIKDDFLNHSSNLTSDTVKQCCEHFSVRDINRTLYDSDFEIVFKNSFEDSDNFIKKETAYLSRMTVSFPYQINENRHELKTNENRHESESAKQPSLFTDFLESLIQNRNEAVHGGMMSDTNLTLEELENDLFKIQSLTLAEIYCFGSKIQSDYNQKCKKRE